MTVCKLYYHVTHSTMIVGLYLSSQPVPLLESNTSAVVILLRGDRIVWMRLYRPTALKYNIIIHNMNIKAAKHKVGSAADAFLPD